MNLILCLLELSRLKELSVDSWLEVDDLRFLLQLLLPGAWVDLPQDCGRVCACVCAHCVCVCVCVCVCMCVCVWPGRGVVLSWRVGHSVSPLGNEKSSWGG